EPTLQHLPDGVELREQQLPDEAVWDAAVRRASEIFGLGVSSLRSAANVRSLMEKVQQQAGNSRKSCQTYVRRLREALKRIGAPPDDADRLKTSEATLALLDRLDAAEGEAAVSTLATAAVATSETAMGTCVSR